VVVVGWTPTTDDGAAGAVPHGDRHLHAREGERIYQSAGSQIFYNQHPPEAAAPCNILPRDNAGFTGRARELRALVHNVVHRAEARTIIPVYAIDGMPGVGKTALAVHAGHMLQDHFRDGQFFVNLHAYTAGQPPVDPADALSQLLSADGVRPAEIPAALEDRAALWRKRMAGSRALVILDNADSWRQVRPLLPGAGHCLVMITSRSRLTGLVATQAPVNLTLETLPPEDATALFATMANRHLKPAEASAVDDLMRVCGYLPLAICLLATRLRMESQWPIADLVRELTQAKHALSRMRAEDVTVEAAFGLSYRQLSTVQRRFFRRLGLHPGPDVDRYAAAALDGSSPRQAGKCLEALYHHHLLDQPLLGRYRMHDLIRQYAVMRADSDSVRERDGAVARLLDYYRRAAESAGRHLSRSTVQPSANPGPADDGLPPVRTRRQAMGWMKAEQANLFACAGARPAQREESVLPALAAAMAPYLRLAGPWDLAIALHEAAAATGEATGDQRGQADSLRELGVLRRHVGQYPAAERALQQALRIYERIGHRTGVADARTELGGVRWRLGNHGEAAAELRAALATYRDLDLLHGQAHALHEMGAALWASGAYTEALEASEQALRTYEELGDRLGAAEALQQIGGLQQLIVGYPPAIDVQERALAIYRELGDRFGEAKALMYLGAARSHTGDYEASIEALNLALAIQRDLGDGRGEAHALNYLGSAHSRMGRYPRARQLLSDALALYRQLGFPNGQADVLNQLGVLERLTGDRRASAEIHEQALALFRRESDELGQSEALSNIGELLFALDRPAEALDRYQEALALAKQAQNPDAEANALHGAGRCCMRLNNSEEGATLLRRAQEIYHRIGVAEAASAISEFLNECPR
jgi:tetratricopeptide (TPR) repeat protein